MTDKVGTGAENTEYRPLLRMLRMIRVSIRVLSLNFLQPLRALEQTQSSSITNLFTTNSYP